MESELVSLLVGAPSVHIAVLDPLGTGKTSVLRNITNDLRVCDYFGGRRLFLSCSDLSTSNAIWSRLAAVLGLELPCSDDGDDDITVAVVLDELAAHKNNTLVILDKLDSIYSAENAIQQDETDVILAVLAAIDDVTLLVSFCGSSLPESVHWTTTENCIPPTHPDVSYSLSIPFKWHLVLIWSTECEWLSFRTKANAVSTSCHSPSSAMRYSLCKI